jgi:hypothetical protein
MSKVRRVKSLGGGKAAKSMQPNSQDLFSLASLSGPIIYGSDSHDAFLDLVKSF